jgi:hypothetical protein
MAARLASGRPETMATVVDPGAAMRPRTVRIPGRGVASSGLIRIGASVPS